MTMRDAWTAGSCALLLWASMCGIGCGGDAPELALCTRTAPDDADPLHGDAVDRILLRAIPAEGLPVQKLYEPSAKTLSLPALDFGLWQFVVQAQSGEEVVATGRTRLVDVTTASTRVACLYVATVGTFGDTDSAPPPGTPRLAISDGPLALIVTDEGLIRYDHETGTLTALDVEPPVPLAGAVWAELPDGRAAVIGLNGQGTILDVDGVAEPLVDLGLDALGPLDGVTAIGTGLTTVLLVGGAVSADADPTGGVRLVDLSSAPPNGHVKDLDIPDPAPPPIRDARIADLGNAQFVIVGGNLAAAASTPVASETLALLDTVGIKATETLETGRIDPIVAVAGGNLLVFGGRDNAGTPLTSVERFRVASGQFAHLQSPDPLLSPRAGGIAIVAGEDVVVVGGATDSADDDVTAERFTFAANGSVPADPPGAALPSPVSTTLFDGTRLIVGSGAAVVYRP